LNPLIFPVLRIALWGTVAGAVFAATLGLLRRTDSATHRRDWVRLGLLIFVGLVINEMRSKFRPGDFLIRSIAGVDPASGAIAIGEPVHVGQTLQFHLRDAGTARDELRKMTARYNQTRENLPAAGCLIFNCLGRGKSLYGCSHHDVKTIQVMNGKLPIGGFFCNGEIGPIGGTNFLHGYTASLGLFRPVNASATSRTTREDAGRAV